MERKTGDRILIGCSVTVFAAAATVVAMLVYVFVSCAPQAPPNVAAVARSAKVTTASRQAATTLNDVIAGLGKERDWLRPHPSTALRDHCGSAQSSGLGRSWRPVACVRRVRIFAGFDGDLTERGRDLHKALLAQGWSPRGGGIPEAMAEYRPSKGKRPTLSPSNGASGLDSGYYELPRADMTRRQPLQMTVLWEEKGFPRDFEFLDLKSQRFASDATTVREERRVDARPLLDGLHRSHRYVMIANLEYLYFDAGAKPTPTPTARPGGYCQCRSGGTCDCPGG